MSEYIDGCQNRLSKVNLDLWHISIVIDTLYKACLVSIASTVIKTYYHFFVGFKFIGGSRGGGGDRGSGLPSPEKVTKNIGFISKVSKSAKIRYRYNQVPHLTQDTNGKVTNSQLDTTNESQAILVRIPENHKGTKASFQCWAIIDTPAKRLMGFRWRANDGSLIVVFGSSPLKKVIKVGPLLTKFSGSAQKIKLYHKIGQGQPRISVWTNVVWSTSPMSKAV